MHPQTFDEYWLGYLEGHSKPATRFVHYIGLFFAPLAGSIPAFATAPALVYVACIMMSSVKEIDFSDVTEYAPAIITIAAMPLTFSIAHGIAFGFITYAGIKLLAGRLSDIKPAVAILAVLFVLKFAYL